MMEKEQKDLLTDYEHVHTLILKGVISPNDLRRWISKILPEELEKQKCQNCGANNQYFTN